tara:strand:- start:2898 stop:3203 length:306 start_codon:yes stop_codon:yes gene_type:complete
MRGLDPRIHVFKYGDMEMEQSSQRGMRRLNVVVLTVAFYLSSLSLFLENVARPQGMYRAPETGDVIWLNLVLICLAAFLVVAPCVFGLVWLTAKWRGRPWW